MVEDMPLKKKDVRLETEWVMFRDECIVSAIVSEELWENVNAVLAVRSLDVKQRQNRSRLLNLMADKLYCEHCSRLWHHKMPKRTGCRGKQSFPRHLFEAVGLLVYALPLMERSACSMRRLVI